MHAMLHVAPPPPPEEAALSGDPRGSFCLMVSPPGPECSYPFSRSVVFMFDRSGSMVGDPLRHAKGALTAGLRLLGPGDEFTVVAFDHEELWWTDGLCQATPDNIAACQQWVNDQAPRANSYSLPFIFLITDGCVNDERDICSFVDAAANGEGGPDLGPPLTTATTGSVYHDAQSNYSSAHSSAGGPPSSYYSAASGPLPPPSSAYSGPGGPPPPGYAPPQPPPPPPPTHSAAPGGPKPLAPRMFTFGIGPYCNHYFLKQLATIGRGMCGVALQPNAIKPMIERMLVSAALPLLSDVELLLQGVESVELFPPVLPDLFCGQPLLVVGKYTGQWPSVSQLHGLLPTGEEYTQALPALPVGTLPIDKLFSKGRLDLLTSQAWMQGNPDHLVKQIIDLSVACAEESR
ncbi:hypothetical protein MNEG_6346 [Monoraphidium neglectum]|uniref:VWFA domain-containing protein n=1 Tax=Monoraphidium neglectum TaxID=145388 RepID=A0A0D2L2Z6_9CHLO|nr:hypothetical protein MNEG_6346 [Monoraphidium neglectum]KIZ01619.1 hypothetical protein MNEG_6346 [Monoraphidium neglectum]|eukprot:XP_013900638.1 hypothetical protein MNEG_6346 [Monoraphidium neglectum]